MGRNAKLIYIMRHCMGLSDYVRSCACRDKYIKLSWHEWNGMEWHRMRWMRQSTIFLFRLSVTHGIKSPFRFNANSPLFHTHKKNPNNNNKTMNSRNNNINRVEKLLMSNKTQNIQMGPAHPYFSSSSSSAFLLCIVNALA